MTFRISTYLALLAGLLIFSALLVSCASEGGDLPTNTPAAAGKTPVPSIENATATALPTSTTPPRSLTICMAEEPETLFIYGGDSLSQRHVLQAIYDGPIDRIGYQFQPVIFDKLPSLADGDAVLEPKSVAEGDLIVNSAGHLVRLQVGESVQPFGCTTSDCAISWDGSPLELPQLSATFSILPDLKWSDGTPLGASDSVFSYQLAVQCETDSGDCGGLGLSNRSGWEMLPRTASYIALDDHTVTWTGVPGFVDPGYQANFFIPLPEKHLSQFDLQELFSVPEAARQPLGWGPYSLTSWVAGEAISLRANPYYSGAQENGLQYDEIIFRFIGDQNGITNLILNGACDIIDQSASRASLEMDRNEIIQLETDGQLQAHFAPGPVWEHVDFGIQPISYEDGYIPGVDRPDLFSDVRVRQAFAMCMNRDRLVEELSSGLSLVPGSYFPPEHPLYNPDLESYPFDPLTGGELLQAAGWVDHDSSPQTPRQALGIQGVLDGTPLVVTYSTSTAEQRQAASQVLADSLAECGIQVELNIEPAEQVFAPGPEGPVFGRRFDLAQFAWSASDLYACQLWTSRQIPGDPSLVDDQGNAVFPFGWGGVNAGGFRNDEYDQACEAALGTLPGQPGFIENHQAGQSIFNNQLPVVPLYQHLNLALARADMCGFSLDPSSFSEFWNIENYNHGAGCSG